MFAKKEKIDKIGLDVAENEFDRFMDAMALDDKCENLSEEDKEGFEKNKRVVIKALRKGSLIINDNGEPVFTPTRSEDKKQITFYEPTGAIFTAQDKRKDTEMFAKLNLSMGNMTKTHASLFVKMAVSDLQICQAIFTLFLA